MTTLKYVCANWAPERANCKEEGRFSCKNCRLVVYCGPTCQKIHWTYHKSECRSPLGKETWKPAWVKENRTPAFMGGGIAHHFGAQKYLWGNVPAFDILRLESNEGEGYSKDLHLLFAASGDLRNVIKTVIGLPSTYNHHLHITINDRDFDIVARNFILLLIALTVEQVDEAVDCILHLWYSALVRESHIEILQRHIRPLFEEVCGRMRETPYGGFFGKKWRFRQCSLTVFLEKSSWDRLLSFVDKPVGLTTEHAHENFFQTADIWPMKDSADPLEGWSSEEVAATSSGAASADIYGKLFYYLQGLLRSFLNRLQSLEISFDLFQLDVAQLPDHMENDTFSRIDVSNISDAGWLGIPHTLDYMVPLLQTPLQNPHATLITLFMNAVDEALTDQDKIRDMTPNSTSTKRLLKYLPPKGRPTSRYDPGLIRFNLARDYVITYDHIFDRYLKAYMFTEAADVFGAKMKEKHTIIEKWPYRLKLRPGQPGAQDEFDRRLCTGLSGKERYLEWKRAQ
ncbi:uncharacterized protein N7503_007303 [Penicillium pulvis]|uniref:uncharacterized protein n=1 Tax=Penicillium pulvis TaxID=1562058 RepID=UPI00254888DE|nr:uncharacterized protein N7503_007303 [Penicillium pulvis]KAJ5798007.1 hypothetical protein N7503_007303 [Penicillium pulvis]